MPPHAGQRVVALALCAAGLSLGCSENEPTAESPPALRETVLIGHVVGPSGEPIVDATVQVDARTAAVGEDGRFTLSFLAAEDRGVFADVSAPGYLTRLVQGHFSGSVHPGDRIRPPSSSVEIRPGAITDLGTLSLERAVPISVRVVTRSGQPVAGAWVELRSAALHEAGHCPGTVIRTGADGLGRDDAHVGASSYEIGVSNAPPLIAPRGMRIFGPREIEITVSDPDDRDTITGVVVDSDGRPVLDALVSAHWRTLPCQTHRDGTFDLYRSHHQRRGDDAVLSVVAEGYEPSEELDVAWGSRGVTVTVTAAKQ